MKTHHKLIFGDAEDMRELEDGSVQLVITSPPYFNAPFDYPDLFESYEAYLEKMRRVTKNGALGGIKPLSLFAYRFKAYEGFIRWLNGEMTPKLVGCLLTGLLSSSGRNSVLKR
jgi:DNA modification methylase